MYFKYKNNTQAYIPLFLRMMPLHVASRKLYYERMNIEKANNVLVSLSVYFENKLLYNI